MKTISNKHNRQPVSGQAPDHVRLSDFQIKKSNRQFENAQVEEILHWAYFLYGDHTVLSTGFGASGIVLMHKVSLIRPGATAFYLDTDLLFKETCELIERIEHQFDLNLIRVQPQLSLSEQTRTYGDRLWESDPDACCHMRKVLPLKKFLSNKSAWITGIRRDQSVTRKQTSVLSYNKEFDVLKINPLAKWSEKEVWNYIHLHNLPFNKLHSHGYPSIGCWPCTRSAGNTQNLREGRWPGFKKTECGIHSK